MTKNAYCPKSFAKIQGLEQFWINDKDGDMGRPVAVFSRKAAESFIAKAPALKSIRITELTRDKNPGVTIAAFLQDAAELSERQGYLSMQDIRELAQVSAQVSPDLKSLAVPFRNVVNRLVILGAIASAKGNKAKGEQEDTTGIDWSEFTLED